MHKNIYLLLINCSKSLDYIQHKELGKSVPIFICKGNIFKIYVVTIDKVI